MPKLYPPAEIDAGLIALIYEGDSERASRRLAETGITIPATTLRDWRSSRADRIRELHEKHGPEIEKALVRQARSIALAASGATLQAIEAARTQLDQGEAKDPAATARNLQTTGAIAIDKLLALTGRPTQITEHRDSGEIVRKLQSLGVVEADAVEETDEPKAIESAAGFSARGDDQTRTAQPA